VAGFGLVLRDSAHRGPLTTNSLIELATEGIGPDAEGHRTAFVELLKRARALGK
jgi:Ca-activated chloride channel family protein